VKVDDADRVRARNSRVQEAMLPLVASLGSWGVGSGHWLPDRDGQPVVWLRTRTRAQRRALESQVWLRAQVQTILTRLGVPHETVWHVRLELTSAEDEAELLAD
jgi:hypothetical protein